MATYRLLRNNKETGPFSVEELRTMGLKAYDLVWVDGRSAAWRYPGELDELKAFAPQVEEQPYDRFYKKAPKEDKMADVPVQKEDAYAVAPEHEKYVPAKSVFVKLPATGHSFKKSSVPASGATPAEPVPQRTISITENPVAATAEVKYSQPLDEIKEMYVRTLNDRRHRMAKKRFWLQSLKKAGVILLLVSVGVLAGLFIRTNNRQSTTLAAMDKSPVGGKQADVAVDLPAAAQEQLLADSNSTANVPPSSGLTDDLAKARVNKAISDAAINNSPQSTVAANRPSANEPATDAGLATTPGVEIDPVSGERNRRSRSEGEPLVKSPREQKAFAGTDISSLVSVASNDYKKVAFGGIRNLELTVTNDSKYTLDQVTVELQYLKPNELPLRTEKIAFKSINPRSASTIRIPDTNRGIKISYRIIQINSSEMDELAAGK